MFDEYLQKISDILGHHEFETFEFSEDVYKDKYGKKEKYIYVRIIIYIIILLSYTALSNFFYIQFEIGKTLQLFFSVFLGLMSMMLFIVEPILLNRYKRRKTLLESCIVYITDDNKVIYTKCEKIDLIKINGKFQTNEDIQFATQYTIYEIEEITKKIIDDKYMSLYGRINYTTFIEEKKGTKIDEGYIHGIDIENVFYNLEDRLKELEEIKIHDFEKDYTENIKTLEGFLKLEENWDNEGAKSFKKEYLMFIAEILEKVTIQPEIFPLQNGTIVLEYGNVNDKYLEIKINEDRTMNIYKINSKKDKIKENNVAFSIETINKEIKNFNMEIPVDLKNKTKDVENSIEKLKGFLNFKQNWNNESAEQFDEKFIEFIINILSQLIIQPEIFPLPSGEIQLEFEENNNKKYLEIIIRKNKTMKLFIIDNNGNEFEENDIEISVERINEEIKKYLKIN